MAALQTDRAPRVGPTAFLLSVLLAAAWGAAALGAVREVGPGKTHATIQAGIDAAAVGDTVLVYPSTYNERIDFKGKAITVQSTNPLDSGVVSTTIINGGAGGSVVTFKTSEASSSVLEGFTITNGKALTLPGGGIRVVEAAPTIRYNVITGNDGVAGSGAGLYAGGDGLLKPTIENNTIENNTTTGNGGGVYLVSCPAVLFRNTIRSNTAARGGGIFIQGTGGAKLEECTIFSNTATIEGGGLAVSGGGRIDLFNSTIGSNQAVSGGGAWLSNCSLNMEGGTIHANQASGAGGGLYGSDAGWDVTNALIRHNTATSQGGGVYAKDCTGWFELSTLVLNSAASGGGIYDAGTKLRGFENLIIASNTGGGIATSGTDPYFWYNNVWNNSGGNYSGMADRTGTEANISADPLFAAPGLLDFRLKSKAGRWRTLTHSWVTDTVTSPCIDAGRNSSDFANEPLPNGGCVNMGFDGNTSLASKSPQNVFLAWAGTAGFVNDGVHPDKDVPGATFEFRLKYQHRTGKYPDYVKVRVWRPDGTELPGGPFQMEAVSGSPATGRIYAKTLTLDQAGVYEYRFFAGFGPEVRYRPREGRQTGPRVNDPPTLEWAGLAGYVNDGVQPNRRPAGATFIYKVLYRDANGNAPAYVRLAVTGPGGSPIPGSPFAMTNKTGSTDWVGGVVFTKALVLTTPGVYAYRFQTDDGYGAVYRPRAGQAPGPTVDAAGDTLALTALAVQQFGDGVTATYNLTASADVQATVLNLAGRVIAHLPAGPQEAGLQSLRWNGRNTAGSLVPAGVYLVRIEARTAEGTAAQAVSTVSLRR